MTAASWPLQQALYASLSGDASLGALVGGRIWDTAPQADTAPGHPFILIGEEEAEDFSSATETGAVHLLTIEAYSRAGGRGEVKQVLAAVLDALQAARPAPAGHALVTLRPATQSVATLTDGVTHRGRLVLRAVTEQIS